MALQKIIPAQRTRDIKYAIRDIIVLAEEVKKSGRELYYLNIGDPNVYGFKTPDYLIEAAVKAFKDNKNGYSESSGIDEARDAIRIDAERKGIKNVLDTFVTNGAADAIEIALTSLLNKGDNFLMPTPGYPLYTAIQSKLEAEPNPYFLDESNGWQPYPDDIKERINVRTRAIVLINPNNPTGSICSKETLKEIVEIAIDNNLVILADEIYDKLIFDDEEFVSIASLNPDVSCITFSGMSKNFMMPGWRLGWGVASGKADFMDDYIDAINKILRSRVSANHPLQYAIKPALLGDQKELKKSIKELEKRRNIIQKHCDEIDGINLVTPQGAFYAFPNIDVEDDWNFCISLLQETGVIVVPGTGFGQKSGSSHFRIVICPDVKTLNTSFKLIDEFYKEYRVL